MFDCRLCVFTDGYKHIFAALAEKEGAVKMLLIKEQDKYYVQKSWKDTEERATITKEIYDVFMKPIWRENKRNQREGKCRYKGTSLCKNDCNNCWNLMVKRRPLSIEQMLEDRSDIAALTFPSPEEQAIKQELYQALYGAICRLNEKQRNVIVLCYFRYMTEQEAADILGVAQKTVNNRKHSALAKLRKILQDF